MNTLLEKIGGGLTTIIVTCLLLLGGMVVANHNHNATQDADLKLIIYRLDELQKDFDNHEGEEKNE